MRMQKYPNTRLRRNRQDDWIRNLTQETEISANDLILPIFILPGKTGKEKIKTMPDVFRLGEKELIDEVKEAKKLGINAVALFPVVPDPKKDALGSYAIDKNNFLLERIKKIKNEVPDIGIICDVALDPYTSHGHDGILRKDIVNSSLRAKQSEAKQSSKNWIASSARPPRNDDYVDNDATNIILAKQAVILAKAGSDFVAPSDMMDGRVGVIRAALEAEGFVDTGIISYSAKYASSLYAPFRDAVGSAKNLSRKDKKTYQMNPANIREALLEVEMDINEGADIVMVKPGIFYLDVIAAIKQKFNIPVFAYQVSGEYSMIKNSSLAGIVDFDNVMLESILCLKRAGANAVFTYAAKEVAKLLK